MTPSRLDALIAAFAMDRDAFVAAHRTLFFVPAARAAVDGAGTARATPAARATGDLDDTARSPGRDASTYWLQFPSAPGRPLMLGRAPSCDLVVVHPSVSRRHAIVRPSPSFIEVEDAGSQHGTIAGGRRLRASEVGAVALGDEVRFADVALVLVDGAGFWSAARRAS